MTPEQRAQFIANVPDADARREAERIWQIKEDKWSPYVAACDERDIQVWDDEIVNEALAKDPDLAALKKTFDDAQDAWVAVEDYDDPLLDDEFSSPIRCALTGFLIHEGDAVLKDESTGEHVLKAALGLPLDTYTEEFIGLPAGAETTDGTPSSVEASA
jgi:hypothetical protein